MRIRLSRPPLLAGEKQEQMIQSLFAVLGAVTSGVYTFVNEVFAFIPNLIAALIILLVGYLIVRGGTGILRRAFQRTNMESHVSHTDIGRWVERSGQTVSGIIVSGIKYLGYLIVVVYAIGALAIPILTATMAGVLAWIPDLIAFFIIVVVGTIVASYIGRAIENTLPRYGVAGGRIIGLAVELLLLAIVFNFALIQIGFAQGIAFVITTAMAWGLAAALAIGIGGALFYSMRQVVPPMISGAATIGGVLKEGQRISIEGVPNIGGEEAGRVSGVIRSVGTFSTIIERSGTDNGGSGETGYVILPNNLLTDKPIVVESGEAPRPWEHNVRQRMSSMNKGIEGQGDGNGGNGSQTTETTYTSTSSTQRRTS